MVGKNFIFGLILSATVTAWPARSKEGGSPEELNYAEILERVGSVPSHAEPPNKSHGNLMLDAELIDHPPRGISGPRIKKQITLPYQWQYFLAPGAPGIVHYWYYPPVPSVAVPGAPEHPIDASTPSWISSGKSRDELLVDQLYSKHPHPTVSPAYPSTLRPPLKSDESLVDELYKKTHRHDTSVSPVDPLINTIHSAQAPQTGFRTAHWQGPVQGHYDAPQTRLSNTGHVIIHDENH